MSNNPNRGLVWLHTVISIITSLTIQNEMYVKNILITGYKHIFKYFKILTPTPTFFSESFKVEPFSIPVQILPFHTCSILTYVGFLIICEFWMCHTLYFKDKNPVVFFNYNFLPPPKKKTHCQKCFL